MRAQARDGRVQRLFQLHTTISTQRTQRNTGWDNWDLKEGSVKQISAGDLRIEDRGESNPRSIGNKRRGSRSVDFAGGVDIGKNGAFQRNRIHKRCGDPVLAEKQF